MEILQKRNQTNYSFIFNSASEFFDEQCALLTHYIPLQNNELSKKYKERLQISGINLQNLPTENQFRTSKKFPFYKTTKPKFTFIDLFAGIGGFRLAMQECGGQCVFSSEWDKAAKQTYFENFGEVPFGDITKDEIKNLIPDDFDILCAGFPCQAFSIAGYQKGFDDVRGTLFFDIADILEKHRPKAFFLENVKNLKTHDKGKTFRTIMDVLANRLNYKVFEKVMNPCEYANLPQNRERIFLIGFNPDKVQNIEAFTFPEKMKLTRTIHDIIDPSVTDEKYFYKENHLYFEKMKDFIINPDTVYQWRRVYIRENKTGVCPTLTANMGEGGHNVPIIRTSKGIRKLTPEECLGFQGFPVSQGFVFPDTIAQSKKYKQAGNSVAQPLITLVTKELTKILGV